MVRTVSHGTPRAATPRRRTPEWAPETRPRRVVRHGRGHRPSRQVLRACGRHLRPGAAGVPARRRGVAARGGRRQPASPGRLGAGSSTSGPGRARSRGTSWRGASTSWRSSPTPTCGPCSRHGCPGPTCGPGARRTCPSTTADVDAVIGAQMWHWVDLGRRHRRGGPGAAATAGPSDCCGTCATSGCSGWPSWGRYSAAMTSHRHAADVVAPAAERPSPRPRRGTSGGPRSWRPPTSWIWWPPAAMSRSCRMPSAPRCWPASATSSPAIPAVAGRGRIVVPYVTSCWRATRT